MRWPAVIAFPILAGCGKSGWFIPKPAPERVVTTVEASFDRTWDAVIDRFAFNNIPIATIDRSSGLIVAKTAAVSELIAERGADCGAFKSVRGIQEERPTGADYNILVRADGPTQSTVRVSISWTGGSLTDRGYFPCQTTGAIESVLEAGIKERAEGKPR